MSSEPDSLRGHLLIASAGLLDPNFRRTVVVVTEHNDDGAMGLVLNRPSPVTVADGVPKLDGLVGDGALVYVGGPVQPEAVVALAEIDDPDVTAAMAFADVGFLRPDLDAVALTGAVRRIRVFAGYSGWSPGQLEAELAEEAWIVEPAYADDVFSADPDTLWSDVLSRKGGMFAVLARLPEDPSVN